MCTVSMVMDHYWDEWQRKYINPPYSPSTTPGLPGFPTQKPAYTPQQPFSSPLVPQITKEEVEEFRRLLERAREYDRKNNEPDCEMQEKRDRIKKLAEELGVKIDFL